MALRFQWQIENVFLLTFLDLDSIQYHQAKVENKKNIKMLIKKYMHFQNNDNKGVLFQIR